MGVLITGAGMIGCQIARILLERGETPILLEIHPQMDSIAGIVDPARVRIVRGDILEPMDLVKVIREGNVDRIIHTVTLFGLSAGVQQQPYAGIKVNIMGTANVLEVSRVLGIKRVVFTGSSTIYLRPLPLVQGQTLTEDFPVTMLSGRAPNIYSTAKQACEQLGLNYWDMFGLDFVAVRFAAAFGPWKGPASGVIGGRIQRAVEGVLSEEETVLDENTMWPGRMDLVYSKDAAAATVLACFAENPTTRVYNVSMGRPYSALEVVNALRELLPGRQVSFNKSQTTGIVGYTLPSQYVDLGNSRAEIGYEPEYDMKAALADYLEWLQRKRR